MKLQTRQIEGFVKTVPQDVLGVLLYGPDDGLIAERADTIAAQIVSDLEDPFTVSRLTGDQVGSDLARLRDEALTRSLMGGRRLVRVAHATDSCAAALKAYLSDPSSDAFVLIEAGELGPRSPLRQLAEKADRFTALPCYIDAPEAVASLLQQTLQQNQKSVDPDASVFFATVIAGNRRQIRAEIEKLITYLGPEKRAQLADVEACVGGASGIGALDDLADAYMMGKGAEFLSTLRRLMGDGTHLVYILRTLQTHVRRLLWVKAQIEAGKSQETVLKSLHPPVFFKREPAFKWQISQYSAEALERRLAALLKLESQAKSGLADEMLLGPQTLLRMAS